MCIKEKSHYKSVFSHSCQQKNLDKSNNGIKIYIFVKEENVFLFKLCARTKYSFECIKITHSKKIPRRLFRQFFPYNYNCKPKLSLLQYIDVKYFMSSKNVFRTTEIKLLNMLYWLNKIINTKFNTLFTKVIILKF